MKNIITLILAGGAGARLGPLTADRSKPAMPFGSKYLIIDFMLSNCFNSGLFNTMVLVQYRAQGLIDHLQKHWPSNPRFGYSMQTVPPQQLIGAEWYRGTADAVYQNLPIIAGWGRFETAVILAGDHILALDFSQMLAFHKAKQSVFTVCVMPVPTAEASRFGVLEVESDGRIISFEEKPKRPKEIPGRPGWSVISLGNYIAALDHLTRTLEANNQKPDSTHDFGQDIIPQLLHEGAPVYAYDFLTNVILGQSEHYWRDVGTVHAFWEANMDIVSITPELNVYNDHWIIRSPYDNLPPAKFIDTEGLGCRVANTVVSGGCIVQDSTLTKAVLGRKVCVYGSDIEASILFSRVNVGYGCKLRRVIIDEGVSLPPATSIGYDLEADRARGLYVDESGIVVVTRSFHF